MKGSINLLYGDRHSWAVSKFVSVDHVSAGGKNSYHDINYISFLSCYINIVLKLCSWFSMEFFSCLWFLKMHFL